MHNLHVGLREELGACKHCRAEPKPSRPLQKLEIRVTCSIVSRHSVMEDIRRKKDGSVYEMGVWRRYNDKRRE